MTTANDTQKLKRLKIIYNNDEAILNFLADLTDRTIIKDLQGFVDDAKGLPGCLLHACHDDGIVVVILYKSPFAFNDPGDTLMLYAGNNLHELMSYFKNLLDNTSDNKSIIHNALKDIVRLLYNEWVKQNDDSATLDQVV